MHIVSMITFIINSLRWLQKMQDHSPIFIQCFPISSYSRNETSLQYLNREQLLYLRRVINKSFLKKCLNKLISLRKWEETMGKAPELLASREINIAGFVQLTDFSFHHQLCPLRFESPRKGLHPRSSQIKDSLGELTHIYDDNECIKHYVLCQNGYWN